MMRLHLPKGRGICVALFLTLGAFPATAQTVGQCAPQIVSAQNLVEPWAETTRTFANGAVRLALLDTVEPAAAAFHLMVLSPPYGELGDRQCRLIGWEAGLGYAGITFDALAAGYDPATGLTFDLPVFGFIPATGDVMPLALRVAVNQANGDVSARILPPQ